MSMKTQVWLRLQEEVWIAEEAVKHRTVFVPGGNDFQQQIRATVNYSHNIYCHLVHKLCNCYV